MHAITIEEAQARLPELVSTLVPGEEIRIIREGHLVATLVAPRANLGLAIRVQPRGF